ncbi:diguanylate cyclase [Amedibacillus sp. YH-ame6]
MKDAQNKAILQQVRVLLDQLDANSENTQIIGNADDEVQLLKKLLQMSCNRYWIYDPIIHAVEIFQYDEATKKEVKTTRSLSALQSGMDDEHRCKAVAAFRRIVHKESTEESFEYMDVHGEQTTIYEIHAHAWEVNNQYRVIGTTKVIGSIQRTMDEVQQAQRKYEQLLSLSNMYIWEFDVKRKIFSANHSLCEKLGLEEKPYTLEELDVLIRIPEMNSFLEWVEQKNVQDKAVVHIQQVETGFEFIFETNFKEVNDGFGDYALLLGIMIDITEHEMLKTMASKDTLTGCFNRNMADVTLDLSFKNYVDNDETYTIIFFDVDKFKTVNDRYGHDMGDYILKSVCGHISKEIRSNDMMFRWGGDEFLLICRGIAKENIYGYIDRLRKTIEQSLFEFNGTKLQVTISIGAAVFYKSDVDHSYAMKRADRSLYKAKLAGRNKVCILN